MSFWLIVYFTTVHLLPSLSAIVRTQFRRCPSGSIIVFDKQLHKLNSKLFNKYQGLGISSRESNNLRGGEQALPTSVQDGSNDEVVN